MTTHNTPACTPASAQTHEQSSGFPHVDIDLETQIEQQCERLRSAQTPSEKRAAWDRFKHLHAMRTPERVSQMERERGLR